MDAILQSAVDDAFRGRVFSFYDVVYNAAFVAAATLAALVLPPDGYSPPVLLAMSALYALAALGYGRLSAREAPHVPSYEGQAEHRVVPRSPSRFRPPAAAHQRSNSRGASSCASGPWSRRSSLRKRHALPTTGPGGIPRISMIALPSRSGRIGVQLLLLPQPGDPLLERVVRARPAARPCAGCGWCSPSGSACAGARAADRRRVT